MIISPLVAIQKGWIKKDGINSIEEWNQKRLISPNGIDFTLDKLKCFNTLTTPVATIGEKTKTMRELVEYPEVNMSYNKTHWYLEGNSVYDGTSDVYVEVPEGVATLLFTRSTFARNGIFIVSGLYDSGYKGHIGFTMYTVGGPAHVERGVRVGQIVFATADSAGMYAGGWNHQQGTHYGDPTQPPQPTGLGGSHEPSGEVFGARGQSKTFL